MTWIEATARQIARGDEPEEKDYQQAEELFKQLNEKREKAGLKPFTN